MATSQARHFKDTVYALEAQTGKAVASPRRLELLDLLAQGPRTVEILAREPSQTLANTSQHLQVLRGAHLVEAEKRGLYVNYRAAQEGGAPLPRRGGLLPGPLLRPGHRGGRSPARSGLPRLAARGRRSRLARTRVSG